MLKKCIDKLDHFLKTIYKTLIFFYNKPKSKFIMQTLTLCTNWNGMWQF